MIAQQVIFGSNLVIFRGRLRAFLSVFINTKNLEFFMECSYIPVLLWKRVLVSWGYILKTAIASYSNIIPFDSK